MREALEALPWVRKAEISFLKKQAIVVVESGEYNPSKLIEAIKSSGFEGKIVGVESNANKRQIVALIVRGMKKAKSGAT